MRTKTFWEKYRPFIIGLSIVALVASCFIPATIGIPNRFLDRYEQKNGQIVNITLVEKPDENTAIFEVKASPDNFYIEVEISLGNDVKPGVQGYVASIDNLVLDGSYEYQYDFLFPRDGNLFQKILLSFGVTDFNRPYEGHVMGEDDYPYTNNELGFSADFPESPEITTDSPNGDLTLTYFHGVTNTSLTYLEYFDVSALASVLNGETYEDLLRSITQEGKEAALTSDIKDLIGWYSGQKDLNLHFDYSDRQGYLSAKTIIAVTDNARTDWYYAVTVVKGNETYTILGARGTEEKAKVAEASFVLSEKKQKEVASKEAATTSTIRVPANAIDWTEAKQHIGETVTVYGTVVGSTFASESNEQPTYINLGAPYPDLNRVSIVVWGEDRGSFSQPPEDMYLGKTVCVTGEIYIYANACNIKVQSPSQIQVVE
ncbi:MAG: hypothetical protein RR547_05965 [Raoultibacter sp.]